MNDADFGALVTRIRNALGCGKDLAADYARAIGDDPTIQLGNVVILDEEGRIIARVPASVLEPQRLPA